MEHNGAYFSPGPVRWPSFSAAVVALVSLPGPAAEESIMLGPCGSLAKGLSGL